MPVSTVGVYRPSSNLGTRGFFSRVRQKLCRPQADTSKPETANEKPLAPRVSHPLPSLSFFRPFKD